MTQPKVVLSVLDGALGVQPPSSGAMYSLMGVASGGLIGVPSAFARSKDVVTNFLSGPLVEAACKHIEATGLPVLLTRVTSATAGTSGAVDVTGVTGTSAITASGVPNDDYSPMIKVIKPGTIGAAGITFQYSMDGGRNFSAIQNLGSASTFALPGAGGLAFNFGSGTLNAGDYASFRTTAPTWDASGVSAGLEVIKNSAQRWDVIHFTSPIDADIFDVIESKIPSFEAIGKYLAWIGSARMPLASETETTYLAAMNGIFGSKQTLHGMLCFGATKVSSAVSGRKYRRPVSFVVAPAQARVSDEQDIADINLGPLPGASIRDQNGNADEHDETIFPGADDARFTALRTWDGEAGTFVNRPRVFSSDTSDFQLFPHRLVMNIALRAVRAFLIRRLNKPIEVNVFTGYIAEHEALDIERGATQAMASVLRAKPKASGVKFVLSRTDNILSTKTLTGDARVIPLGYPEDILVSVGFLNPALQTITA